MKVEVLDDLVDGHIYILYHRRFFIPASEDLLIVWRAFRARLFSTVLLLILAVYFVLS